MVGLCVAPWAMPRGRHTGSMISSGHRMRDEILKLLARSATASGQATRGAFRDKTGPSQNGPVETNRKNLCEHFKGLYQTSEFLTLERKGFPGRRRRDSVPPWQMIRGRSWEQRYR